MRRLSFFDRPFWLVTAGFVLLAALLLSTLRIASDQQADQAWVVHTLDVQKRLGGVLSLMQDAETGQRGYLVTGDPVYLEPYQRARRELPAALTGLDHAIQDNPRQRAAMGRLTPLAQQRLGHLQLAITQQDHGDREAAAAVVRSGEGRRLMAAFREQVAAMQAEEDRLLAFRTQAAGDTAVRLRIALIFGFLLIVLLTIGALASLRGRLREALEARDGLEAANARLRIEAASREVAEAQVRQMQKTEAIAQLTGGIAHDFNNMLSIIIGSLDMARRRLKTDLDKAQVNIDTALEGAQRAAALTARLLAFSRQQPLEPKASDPNKLVGGMSELLRRTLGEQVRIETVLAGGVWRVHADVSQLESAILNLCVNARDAMPGGGKLTIETTNAHLDDAYAAEHAEVHAGQYVMIGVTDTGTGMPADVVQRAFDPFFTTKSVGKGTGLGLSQVFGFVKQSGGHVKIYSEPGHGTAVKIYLPRWASEAETEAAPSAARQAPRAATETILVVEDDPNVRKVTVDTLRELGYVAIHAGSGDEALRVLEDHPAITLLFTDIVMPEMNGRRLADEAVARKPGLKVLYTTGYTRNAVVHNGVLDPGVAFIAKPFTLEQLSAKLRQVLDGDGAAS